MAGASALESDLRNREEMERTNEVRMGEPPIDVERSYSRTVKTKQAQQKRLRLNVERVRAYQKP